MSTIYFPSTPATFIHIPRTGGTSLETWAKNNNIDFEHHSLSKNEIHKKVLEKELLTNRYKYDHWSDLGTVFTFVRNPYERMVSLYHRVGQRAEKNVIEYRAGIRTGNLKEWKVDIFQSDNLVQSLIDEIKIVNIYRMGFENWITCVYENPEKFFQETNPRSHHTVLWWTNPMSQVKLFDGVTPDIVIKTEELDMYFIKIQELLKCYAPLPKVHTSKHEPYQFYYNSRTQEMVKKMFADDLDMFGYNF